MKQGDIFKKDLYYTHDHEWIDFQGAVAYSGVCSFKLTGFKTIENITFTQNTGIAKQGDIVALIKYRDYVVEAHMPVNGKILQVNEQLLGENKNLLIMQPETAGWIMLIVPSLPCDRTGLVLSRHYQENGMNTYAKG